MPRGHTEFKVTPHSHQQVNYNFIFKHTDCMLVSTPNDLTCLIFFFFFGLHGVNFCQQSWKATQSSWLQFIFLTGCPDLNPHLQTFQREHLAAMKEVGSGAWGRDRVRREWGLQLLTGVLRPSVRMAVLVSRFWLMGGGPAVFGWRLRGVSTYLLDDCITARSTTGSEAALCYILKSSQ